MKFVASIALFAVLALHGGADEKQTSRMVPQARLRLDPTTHAPVTQPASTVPSESGATILMVPVVVRASSTASKAPQQEKPADGPFSLLKGGRFVGKDIGPFKIEVGIWPHFDILGEDASFETQKHVGVDLLRMSW
jgi:hypothetical protein